MNTEKRLLLAMLLSFVLLYVWTGITAPRGKNMGSIKNTQHVDNSYVANKEPHPPSPPALNESITETIQTIESDLLTAHFSDIGGSLKKIVVKQFDQLLPLTNYAGIENYENSPFRLTETGKNFIKYELEADGLKIEKSYRFSETEYIVEAEIKITNISEMSKQENFRLDNFKIDTSAEHLVNNQSAMLLEYSVYENNVINRKHNAIKFNINENKKYNENVQWFGFRDQYFCAISKPNYNLKEYFVRSLSERELLLGGETGTLQLDPQKQILFDSLIYAGPQDTNILKSYGHSFEKIITYSMGGFFDIMSFGLTDPIVKALLPIMKSLHKIIPSWGVIIILIAFAVYAITFPITRKTMVNMKETQKRMQVIQPEIAKLRERYSNDHTKLNKALMELYKKHNFNPLSSLGGCLPLILQMPVFISLYQLLWRTYYFKGASFLWMKDLSLPDRLFILPFNLPILGNEFNILPLYYAFIMVVQQKLQAKNMVISDPAQAQAQKMMSKIFPVMFAVLFYKFSSGLTMYFCVYFTLNAVTQWYVTKDEGKAVNA